MWSRSVKKVPREERSPGWNWKEFVIQASFKPGVKRWGSRWRGTAAIKRATWFHFCWFLSFSARLVSCFFGVYMACARFIAPVTVIICRSANVTGMLSSMTWCRVAWPFVSATSLYCVCVLCSSLTRASCVCVCCVHVFCTCSKSASHTTPFRWLRTVSRARAAAPALDIPAWPQDIRIWWGPCADDGSRVC